VRFSIDLTAEGFPDDFRKLQPWAQKSLTEALEEAALDPYQLRHLPQLPPNARVLGFADGDGLCLVELDEETRTLTARIMQAPR
jgi:hypothetical protein